MESSRSRVPGSVTRNPPIVARGDAMIVEEPLSRPMLSDLHAILNLLEGGFRDFRVLVVGNIMLDRYINGKVDRISPEAPADCNS